MARRPWIFPGVAATLARMAFWLVALVQPISNENREAITPSVARSAIDLHFYLASKEFYANLLGNLVQGRFAGSLTDATIFISGPVLPLLMMLTGFGPSNPWALSVLFLAMGCLWTVVWIWWLSKRSMRTIWLYVFAFLPLPYWFMLNISSDVPFSIAVGLFFLIYFQDRPLGSIHVAGLVALALVALGTRPNGLSLGAFLLVMLLTSRKLSMSVRLLAGVAAFGLLVVLLALFRKYFDTYMFSSAYITYFGISQDSYLRGVFEYLPAWLDLPLSWLALLGAKLLYLVGLRESYGDTGTVFVLLRASAGLILLPGLVRLFVAGFWQERVFVLTFLFPIILGATQERYVLAIAPILFFHGAVFYEISGRRWLARVATRDRGGLS